MKKWLCALLAAVLALSLLLTACEGGGKETEESSTEPATETEEPSTEETEEPSTEEPGPVTYSRWFNNTVMNEIPAYITSYTFPGDVLDVGDDWYQIDIHNCELEDYRAYVEYLQECGFEVFVDNGENGLDGFIYSTTFTKDDIVLTVCYVNAAKRMYATAAFDKPLSKALFYDESAVEKNIPGKKTTLSMFELVNYGNGFIMQLKNGHFIIWDCGIERDCYYMVDYLESLAPAGEKPIIDAIIISHDHGDHGGFLSAFITDEDLAGRVIVNNLFYNYPSENVISSTNSDRGVLQNIHMMSYVLMDENGETVQMYRPQMGQRLYFDDVEIDVVWSQEYIPLEDQSGDMNDTSTYLMFKIDGQTFFSGGDAEWGTMLKLMETYTPEYLHCDIYQILHHGYNTWDFYTDWIGDWSDIVCLDSAPVMREANPSNAYLRAKCAEWLNWGDGTIVLTFPYTVGSYVRLPKWNRAIH